MEWRKEERERKGKERRKEREEERREPKEEQQGAKTHAWLNVSLHSV